MSSEQKPIIDFMSLIQSCQWIMHYCIKTIVNTKNTLKQKIIKLYNFLVSGVGKKPANNFVKCCKY